MPGLNPNEYVQRAAVLLGSVLRPVVEANTPGAQPWSEVYARRDQLNGAIRRYSLEDPRFLLRVVAEHGHRFGAPPVDRTQITYVRELQDTLNHVAHEPQNVTVDSASRALSTMRLLLAPWNHQEADRELVDLLAELSATADHASEPGEAHDDAKAAPAFDSSAAGGAEKSASPGPDRSRPAAPLTGGAIEAAPPQEDDLPDGQRQVVLQHGGTQVRVTTRESTSFALVNNDVSPIIAVAVRNDEGTPTFIEELSVELVGTEMDFSEPRQFATFRVEPHSEVELGASQVAWALPREGFVHLDEARSALVQVSVTIDGFRCRGSVPIRLLAYDEWTARSIPELLGAFITPNATGVAEILGEASEILRASTGNASLQGYQSGRGRAVDIARALYEAIAAREIVYAEPPASFERDSQKIRSVEKTLGDQLGTCLDFAVLYCAALEQAGLNPVVVEVPGHVFAGVLTEDVQLGAPALSEPSMIDNLLHTDLFIPVEITFAAAGKGASFDEAVAATRKWQVAGSSSNPEEWIRYLLDVRAAHRRVKPLPSIRRVGDTVEIVVEREAVPAIVVGERSDGPAVAPEVTRPRRVENWRSALLDLSLRNPLLKLKASGGLSIAVTEATLPRLEDVLAAGDSLSIRPADEIDEIYLAQGKRSADQLDSATLLTFLASEQQIFASAWRGRPEPALDRLRRRARVVQEESGANNLFLTLGALEWTDSAGRPALAPLFLLPVVLEGRRGHLHKLRMEPGAQVLPNYCLLEKLRREHDAQIPVLSTPPADDAGIDLAAVFAEVRTECLVRGLPFMVRADCRLALLQFSTLEMWRDVTENWEGFLGNPLVRHLVETPLATFEDPVTAPAVNAQDESRCYLPLPVDGSQLRAVRWATAGRTFVLQGPPGTGKSQTITNVIADCVSNGRTVLFVAEKQVALEVVRQRLDEVGLGALSLDIHGRDQSIKTVRTQLAAAMDVRPSGERAHFEVARAEQSRLIDTLDSYPHRLHETGRAGVSVWQAHQQVLAHGDIAGSGLPAGAGRRSATSTSDGPIVVPGRVIKGLTDHDQLYRTARHLEQALRELGCPPAEHTWSFVGPFTGAGDPSPADLDALGQAVHRLALASDALSPTLRSLVNDVATAGEPGRWAMLVDVLRRKDAGYEVRPSVWRERRRTATSGESAALIRDVEGHQARFAIILPMLQPQSANLDPAALRSELHEAEQRSALFGARRKARHAVLEKVLLRLRPGAALDADRLPVFLDDLAQLRSERAELTRRFRALLGDHADADVDFEAPQAVQQIHDYEQVGRLVDDLLRLAPGAEPQLELLAAAGQPGRGGVSDPSDRSRTDAASVQEWIDAWAAVVARVGGNDRTVQEWQGRNSLFSRVISSVEEWQDQLEQGRLTPYVRMRRVRTLVERLRAEGFTALSDALWTGDASAWRLEPRLRAAISAKIREERLEFTGLDTFTAADRAEQIEAYRSSTQAVRRLLVAELPARVATARDRAVPRSAASSPRGETRTAGATSGRRAGAVRGEGLSGLRKEVGRKRGGTIRELFNNYGQDVLVVTPCVLMSPSSVAKNLPYGSVQFDVVIFDEASQIRVADAVGAMGRASSVVVVGDSKQMPPTSMFTTTFEDEDGDEDWSDDEVVTPSDQESILSEAFDSNVESLWLTWHYRSQGEELIAFSNSQYYQGMLASFPSPPGGRPGVGVRLQRVEGRFDGGRGGSRTNEVEARAIVADIERRLVEHAKASIGVVTLNSQQRDLIEDLLEASTDPRVRQSLLAEHDGIFVKNLENVQGDERDVVLFSLAFSPDPATGRLGLNFGPLIRAGGERRLNVAITRARRQVVLYSSFDPEMIDLARTNSDGMKHLREYLLFARDGHHRVGGGATGERDLHRDDVAEALRSAGLEVRPDVGMSTFRVDLAIRAADGPWVAILLDGERWAERPIVADRDDIPTAMLRERMGWAATMPIWLPAWISDKDAVVAEVVALADQVRGRVVDEGLGAERVQHNSRDEWPVLPSEGKPGGSDD